MFLFHNNVHIYFKIILNVYSRVKRHIGTGFVSIQVFKVSCAYRFVTFLFLERILIPLNSIKKQFLNLLPFTMTFLTIENQTIVTALKIRVMFTTMYVPFPKSVNEAQVTNVSRIRPSRARIHRDRRTNQLERVFKRTF